MAACTDARTRARAHTHTHTHTNTHVYTKTQRERDRQTDRQTDRQREREFGLLATRDNIGTYDELRGDLRVPNPELHFDFGRALD